MKRGFAFWFPNSLQYIASAPEKRGALGRFNGGIGRSQGYAGAIKLFEVRQLLSVLISTDVLADLGVHAAKIADIAVRLLKYFWIFRGDAKFQEFAAIQA